MIDWPYAILVQQAAENNGPEAFLESIRAQGYLEGLDEGRFQGGVIGTMAAFSICCIGALVHWGIMTHKAKSRADQTCHAGSIIVCDSDSLANCFGSLETGADTCSAKSEEIKSDELCIASVAAALKGNER